MRMSPARSGTVGRRTLRILGSVFGPSNVATRIFVTAFLALSRRPHCRRSGKEVNVRGPRGPGGGSERQGKNEGDPIQEGEALVAKETARIETELESNASGVWIGDIFRHGTLGESLLPENWWNRRYWRDCRSPLSSVSWQF